VVTLEGDGDNAGGRRESRGKAMSKTVRIHHGGLKNITTNDTNPRSGICWYHFRVICASPCETINPAASLCAVPAFCDYFVHTNIISSPSFILLLS